MSDYSGTVTIVGAGASGLYAAWLLKNAGATVRILEATDRIGGRIRELTGFSDFPIEVGAEEIHGHRSTWYDLVKDTDAEFVKEKLSDYLFLDGAMKNLDDLAGEDDYRALMRLIDDLADYSGADITMEAYLAQEGISTRLMPLGNALLGNEYGTSNALLGVKGVAQGERLWSAGKQNDLLSNRSFVSILQESFAPVLEDVLLNRHVFRIDYSGDEVVCHDITGERHRSDRVIVTVPLGVLKAGLIQFDPGLPFNKLDAIAKLGMGPGMKVILKFAQRFWPEKTGSLYGSGLVPEFWATGAGGRSATDNLLTAFVHGENAATLSAMGAGLVPAICAELDQLFGNQVATGSLQDSHVEDWFANPYFQGTYSYPMVGSGNARKLLAAPEQGKLFFAGEATHYEGHYGTVHGALESGYRAAREVVDA